MNEKEENETFDYIIFVQEAKEVMRQLTEVLTYLHSNGKSD